MTRFKITDLVQLAASGDQAAIHTLLYESFRDSMEKVIRLYVRPCDDNRIEDWLSDFQMHLLEHNAKGELRCRNLSSESSPRTYLGTALGNFIKDRMGAAGIKYVDPKDDQRYVPAGYSPVDDAGGIAAMQHKELEIATLIEALETLDSMPAYDRYVLLTFLIGERFRGERPLKIREALALQLGRNASTLYNKYSDCAARLRDVSREILRRKLMN